MQQSNMVLRGNYIIVIYAFVYVFGINAQMMITSDAGFLVSTRDKSKQKKVVQKHLICSLQDGCVCVNGFNTHRDFVCISPIEGALYYNNTRYTNTVSVSTIEKNLSLVPMGKAKKYVKPAKILPDFAQSSKKVPSLKTIKNIQKITIRVLLDQLRSNGMWKLESADGFIMWNPKNKHKKWHIKRDTLLVVRKGKSIYLNGRKLIHDRVYLRPKDGHISFDGRAYEGGFLLHKEPKGIMLINCLDLEKYIYSVLRTESWPGWPVEVNKVFAIASRSYVIAMVLRAKKNNKPFHVRNSNFHQTYTGVHNCKIIKRAVEQTRGMFLAYENSPILAMFDSCCGGVVPAHISDFNFADAPYLAREYACMFCKKCRIYSWQAEWDLHRFENQLTARIAPIAKVRDVRVTKKDKAGLVKKVAVKSAVKPLDLTGQKLYSLIDEVKSFCFTVRKKGKKIVFNGRGYGHHLGLCQWGARQMVNDGYDYKQILSFYYPGTDFKRLS